MKFSLKLLLWTMVVMAVTLGTGGFYFVNYVFQTSLARETGQALEENSILIFAFETAALNVPAKYDVLPDHTVEQIASNLESSGQNAGRMLRLSDEEKHTLYVSRGFDTDDALLYETSENNRTYRVLKRGDQYFIQTGSVVGALDRRLYLETMKDVSGVFAERAMGFKVYRRMMLLMLSAGAVIMHFIAFWLTKPIRNLAYATRQMAAGDYGYRAKVAGRDELGQLTRDFNRMAEALEENVGRLRDEIQAREEFVGAFAHELKTPLTSIIGYADLLRSRKLDEEKHFLSANYIYTEGKRLETMSVRLLDIMVARHGEVKCKAMAAERISDSLREVFLLGTDMEIRYDIEKAVVFAEADLIRTVLINLVDNARKASDPGGVIEVTGSREETGYRFAVRDYGVGIPEEERERITKAFYMIDKSRSRSRNGAGLGLALCTEILALHRSRLEIESVPGEGSRVGFVLPRGEEETSEKDEN